MLDELDRNISRLDRYLIEEESKKRFLESRKEACLGEKEELEKEIKLLEDVNILLQKTSNFAREQSKKQIEQLTTNCLQFIFENDIGFQIDLDESYGKASADFFIVEEKEDLLIKTRPVESRGGGLVDIVSLALRISFLQLYKPFIAGPLILDEPAKHVSEEYIYNVADFLKRSAEMFNRQIIMVTHNDHLASIANRSYRVSKVSDTSSIELVLDD